MKRTAVLLAIVGFAIILSSTVAFAAINKVTCKAGAIMCKGTNKTDAILGSVDGDSIRALAGNDRITGAGGDDATDGGSGNDVYYYNRIRSGSDTLQDASGKDTLNFSALVAPVIVNLTPSVVQHEVQIQNPFGMSGPIIIIMPVGPPLSTVNWDAGAAEIEDVVGGQSSDSISGSAVSNVLSGGDGNDMITTGTAGGNDTFSGGEGLDYIMLSGNGATAHGGNDNDFMQAINDMGGGFSGIARLYGEAGDDNILGAAASDYLSGGKGRVYLADMGGLASNDVYKFERGFGADTVADSNGTYDTADLRAYSRSEIEEIQAADLAGAIMFGGPDGMLDSRVIEFKDGSVLAFMNFYGNTSADLGTSIPGTGFVENIELKDGIVSAAALSAMTTEASTQEEMTIESRIASPPKPGEIPEVPENLR
jgi:Ca2+-binding RTX toxin-like protein